MKPHLPKILFVAVLATCGMAYGDLTVTTTAGKTTVSSADWTSEEYTTVTLFDREKDANTVTTQQDATILGANSARVEIKSGDAAAKLGDIIVGRTASNKNGQIFIQTYEAGANVEVANNIFLGSSSYDSGKPHVGALRFGMDEHDATLSGQVTLIEDSTISGSKDNQNHVASFTQNIAQEGNHSLTLSNYFETHFDGGMSIGGITVQSGNKAVSIGAENTVSNMTGSIVNTSSGTLTLTGTFNFAKGENADMSKYTYASSSYATENGTWITEKGLATQHLDDYYVIFNTGSGRIDMTNATITGATQQADGSYTITGSLEALTNPTYVVVSGTATQDDMAGATDLVLAGGSATITSGGENAFITGDISIESGSTLTLTANNALGWNTDTSSGAVNNITLVGESNSNRAKLTTNGSQTLATNLRLNGHTVIDGTGDFETFGGRIVATGTDNTISATLKVRNPLTVEVTNSGDTLNITSALTTSTRYYSGVTSQVLTKAGAGTLTLSGGILVNQDMDLTITGGTGTTTVQLGASGTNSNVKSIKVKDECTLTLNNVTVTDLRFDNAAGFAGTVVLNGVSGYLNNDSTNNIANDISIGSNGFTINNGYSDHIYNFTGAISGSGNISRTAQDCGKQTYKFSDVAAWSGKFVNQSGSMVTSLTFESSSAAGVENHASGTMEVTMKGTSYTGEVRGMSDSNMNLQYTGATGDVTVSGSIYDDASGANRRGTINVTVDNAGHTTTFGNWVTVHDMHVKSGSTADFIATADTNHFKPESLTLEDAAIIGVYTDRNKGTEANANIGALTLNGDATMNANLVLKNNATLNMSGVLTMGSKVTIGTGTVLTIDESLGDVNIAPVVLFNSVENLALGTEEITEMGWYDANGIIDSINGTAITGADQYVIGYWNGNVSVAAALVPEPTTATLSLLALAGLCARRRRK